jgi:hypothetical protein
MIEHSESHAIFKAKVYVPTNNPGDEYLEEGALATGHGSETKSDFGDFIEKAETKAIGRALAALGFGTQFCDDFAEGDSVTDAPVQRKGPVKSYDGQRKPTAPQEPQFCDDFAEGDSVTDAPVQRKGPVKSYDGQRKPTAPQEPGQSRNALRKALTRKFGPDEQAAFYFMEATEPGSIDGTGIDFSVITVGRCKEIVAILEEPA